MSPGFRMLTPNLAMLVHCNFSSILLSCCLQMPFGWRSGVYSELLLLRFSLGGEWACGWGSMQYMPFKELVVTQVTNSEAMCCLTGKWQAA